MIGVMLTLMCENLAQTVTVTDAGTGLPIAGASFISSYQNIRLDTDSNGKVEISRLNQSELISIEASGYKTIYRSYADILNTGYIILLERNENKLDEVVISASKVRQVYRDVSARVTKILPQDVYFQNPQTAADLLGTSGEVFIQKSQMGGGSPMIRGFSANRLLYTVDGIRMNTAIFRGGNLQNVISLDGLAMENVEVFFGPGSIIYGSDAIGGVMSFQTLSPKLSSKEGMYFNGDALLRQSTANNEKTAHADLMYGGSRWAGVSSVTYSDFGDLRMGSYGPEEYLRIFYVQRINDKDSIIANPDPEIQRPSGYSQLNIMQKLRFKPGENWNLEYGFHFSETSEYSRYDRLIETINGVPRSAVWKYGPQKWNMHALKVSYQNSNKFFDQADLRLALQHFEESRIDRNYSGGQRFRLRTQLEQVKAYSANLDFEKKSGNTQWVYGLEYVLNDVKSTGSAIDIRNNNPVSVPDRYPASTWTSMAAYLTANFKLSDRLNLHSGIRYNAFAIQSDFTRHLSFYPFDFTTSELSNSALNGIVGMVFSPDHDLKISITGSTGFRAPNVDDVGKIFDFGAREVVVPNASLKAEYAYNGEISILKYFGDLLLVDLSAFYTYLDNAMVRRAFQVGGRDSILYNGVMSKVFAIQNAAFGDVYGLQAGLEIRFNTKLKLRTQYNYQMGNEELDNGEKSRSRHAAPAFGVTRLIFNSGKFNAEAYTMYSSEVSYANLNEEERQKPAIYATDADGKPYAPSWYTLNVKAGYRLSRHIHLFAGLENITDQRYRPYSSGIVAPGRNAIVSVKINY